MGVLSFFELNKYKGDILIETGTGIGTGISYALTYNFEAIHSCEIMEETFIENVEKFKAYDNVKLFKGDSLEFLETILPTIPKDKKIVFWLDAHFPGADYLNKTYIADNNKINLPLVHEMDIIYKYRNDCEDVILIDDLRILIPIHKAQLEKEGLFLDYPGLGFLDKFTKHTYTTHYLNEGYLEVVPKD